ncbi:hypothetical protein MIMGU_mgv1a021867mg [Erythranthe guttata]|uniref:U-box domain-containing protein n=1 Tax=Erythranthe guttata TaxID=4155 RepID=A0A022RE81_ERYGU|nr:hypothetical protein MIMGU_mgv1a021867mg [Erythranthe guttata]
MRISSSAVTAVSGITYDRDSIEHWLFDTHHTICPVTKQPLLTNSDFLITPNHTLRRLIQAWSTVNSPYAAASGGGQCIPTPKTPVTKSYVANLVRKLRIPSLQMKTLEKLEALAAEMNERNRVCMVEAGLAEESNNGLEVALSILYTARVWIYSTDENDDEIIMDSLMWVFGLTDGESSAKLKLHASHVLKSVVKNSNPRLLERLKPDFFRNIGSYLRGGDNINALLYVFSEACKWGRNRAAMVEAGVVFDLVEVELRRSPAAAPEKRTTELVLGVIHQLCSCAEGRAQLLSHAAGVAVVTRRMLKVSPAADERAVMIVWLISKHSATSGVVTEMLRVGTVAKLCMVMQANCGTHLKEKARDILRAHCTVWKDSPCVEVATLTRFTR